MSVQENGNLRSLAPNRTEGKDKTDAEDEPTFGEAKHGTFASLRQNRRPEKRLSRDAVVSSKGSVWLLFGSVLVPTPPASSDVASDRHIAAVCVCVCGPLCGLRERETWPGEAVFLFKFL